MSERYTRVFSLAENLYAAGSPVVIAAGALLKDNQTGKVLAQLKLTNIQYKKIKAVKVKLFPQDTMGQPLGETIDYQYLDLQLIRDGDFGSKTPIPFPDATTRAFAVEVTAVVFADNTAWNSDASPWAPIPDSIPLHRQYDDLVIEQLRLEQCGTCQFVVQEHKDLWLCTCGAVNHEGETRCHDCGKQLSQIHPLDVEGLTERAKQRLAEEARQVAEEKAAREAAAVAAKNKTVKILKVLIPTVCAVVAITLLTTKVIIPNSKYNKAVSLMDAGQYDEAVVAFEAMDGYKDSADQITNCENAIAAAEQARIQEEIAVRFARAEELLAAGDYDGAIAIYESLADYEGSAEGIDAAEEGKLETAYKAAETLAKNGETAKAAIAFGKLGDYQIAADNTWANVAVREVIGAGEWHTAALKSDGTVIAVGSNQDGQCDISGWTNVIAISVGDDHTVGLMDDGTVVATGSNQNGQCNVSGWTNIVAVNAGARHTLGLKQDGTVVAAGYNQYGQCDTDALADIMAVSAGYDTSTFLKSDGTVIALGDNFEGMCNVDGWNNITAIETGLFHTVGLKADGTVVAKGQNKNGQCNVSSWADIVAISTGSEHTVGLKSNGTVVAVGVNSHGECNVGDWTDIVAISAGYQYTIGLKADGTMVTVGSDAEGKCNTQAWDNIKYPSESIRTASQWSTNLWNRLPNLEVISTGLAHTVGLHSNGSVVATGANDDGRCNVADWNNIVAVCAGDKHTVGLKTDGTVVAVGLNAQGQCNVDNWTNIVAISAGSYHTLGLCADGTVVAVGQTENGQCEVSQWKEIVAISAGDVYSVGLRADGTVVAVGYNEYGQCNVSNWSDITAISASFNHTVGLRKDGSVVVTGASEYNFGQCDVNNWADMKAISAGAYHTVGLRSNGMVVATGCNRKDLNYGQCDVTGWSDIVAVSAGWHQTIGVRADGTVVAIGDNADGQCNVSSWKNIKLPN